MGISVREALQLSSMSEAILVGGADGIDNIIESVNIMEVPDIGSYIKPSELLLTTAYPIKDNLDALKNLIPELSRRNLAALAIKPKRYILSIPEFMVEQANQFGFPLIQLPDNTSFNEIINPILMEILNRQAAILHRNEQISKALTNIMLYGGGLNEILRTLANIFELPVSVHDPSFRKIASCLSPRDYGADNNRMLAEIINDYRRLATFARGKGTWSTFGAEGGCNAICRPVTVNGETCAYLFIWEPEKPLLERKITSVDQAVTVIALEISKQRAILAVESQFKSSFIEYLADGQITSREEAVSRAEKFGWQLAEGFSVMLFEDQDLHTIPVQDPLMARRKKTRLFDLVSSIVTSLSLGSAVIETGNRIMVLHCLQPGQDTRKFKKSSEALAWACCRELEKQQVGRVLVGISRFIKDVLQVGEGIRQAKRSLELGRRAFPQKQVFHFDDLGVYRILASSDETEMRNFFDDILARLVTYDKKNNSNLIETLKTILACDMNLKQAAESMFIHYNTLRYRVNRIQEITGLNLKSPEDRLNLQLAIKILEMKSLTLQ